MNSKDIKLNDIIFETVSRQSRIPLEKLRLSTMLDEDLGVDPNMHYRILVDIEKQLGLNPLKGNWSFENASIKALIVYYDRILKKP